MRPTSASSTPSPKTLLAAAAMPQSASRRGGRDQDQLPGDGEAHADQRPGRRDTGRSAGATHVERTSADDAEGHQAWVSGEEELPPT